MKFIRTITIATALSFALPAAAFAADGDTAAETKAKRTKEGHEGQRPRFPMKADKFMAHVETRIAKVKARVERRLDKSDLDDAAKAKIRAGVDQATGKVHAAAEKAAADGTVTKEEAKRVREVAREMREKARALRKEHGKKKGKGKRDGKDKRDGKSRS